MNLELSGKTEKIEPYRTFGEGQVVDLVPGLIEAGYNLAGVAVFLERRENAPEDVIKAWQLNYFWTGDSSGTDETGCAVLTLDSQLLRKLNSQSPLSNTGALNLSGKQWNDLKNDKGSLNLTSEEVDNANEQGYIKNDKGVWRPANSEVGKVWEGTDTFPGLARGRDVQSYAQLVSEKSRSNHVMKLKFDRTKPNTPNLRSLLVLRIDGDSVVSGDSYLDCYLGRLAGIAQKDFLKVDFDPKTYSQLEKLAQNMGTSRAGVTRRVTRLLLGVVDQVNDGYKFALLKEGEDPKIIDFEQ